VVVVALTNMLAVKLNSKHLTLKKKSRRGTLIEEEEERETKRRRIRK
jgi:hypothetical protein